MTSEYALADIQNGNGKAEEHVHTTAVPAREAYVGYDAPKSHIPLSQIDEGDMYRLGRQQELNVRNSHKIPAVEDKNAHHPSGTFASYPSWASRSS